MKSLMNTRNLVFAGMLAALYIVLVASVAPISFGPFQFRIAEALAVLPFLFPAAIPGIFVGCLAANLMFSPYGWPDWVFGSLASLIAAYLTARCKTRWLAPLPPILVNAVIIGGMIAMMDPAGVASFPVFVTIAAQVGFGQLVVCAGLGIPLLYAMEKLRLPERLSGRR